VGKYYFVGCLILVSCLSVGGCLGSERILVVESLAETLWRLEEVRLGFRLRVDAQVKEALKWVLSRQGLEGSYRNLFSPTENDVQGIRLLTGERIVPGAALRHILGEEALRTVVVWNLGSSPAVVEAVKSFYELLELGVKPARETGFYCCYRCTPAFLRTLAVVQPKGWKETLEKGIGNIGRSRTVDGRWRGFPYFYTLLLLSEVDMASAKAELRHASKVAEGLLKRYGNDDRTSRFRRLGLEAALKAA